MTIRPARANDAAQIAALLGELGYPATPEAAASQFGALASLPGAVLVAEIDDSLRGLIAVTWAPMLHLATPLARIATLVIAGSARRTGLGRLLLDRATELATAAGCAQLEVTTSTKRHEARQFYLAQGFSLSSHRLHKNL